MSGYTLKPEFSRGTLYVLLAGKHIWFLPQSLTRVQGFPVSDGWDTKYVACQAGGRGRLRASVRPSAQPHLSAAVVPDVFRRFASIRQLLAVVSLLHICLIAFFDHCHLLLGVLRLQLPNQYKLDGLCTGLLGGWLMLNLLRHRSAGHDS